MGKMSDLSADLSNPILEEEVGRRLARAETLGKRLMATRIMPLAQEAMVSSPERKILLLSQIIGLCRMEKDEPPESAYAPHRTAN